MEKLAAAEADDARYQQMLDDHEVGIENVAGREKKLFVLISFCFPKKNSNGGRQLGVVG